MIEEAPSAAAARVALICSVALEAEPLRTRLAAAEPVAVGRRPALRGTLRGVPVLMLTGGMGKTNAAQALTALLESHTVAAVVGFGVGGAYAGVGLAPGEVALATAEVYGDEGVEAPTGWLSTQGIGIPLLDRGDQPRFNEFPLDPAWVRRAEGALRAEGIHHAAGRFLTVSACSGTSARGAELALRHDALCETMEGAAYAHVAAHYGLPFLEVRGISNRVEDRDLSGWRLREAAEAAARAVAVILPALFA